MSGRSKNPRSRLRWGYSRSGGFRCTRCEGRSAKNLGRLFSDAHFAGREIIIRINPLSTPDGMEDLKLVLSCRPDAVLLPKVEQPADINDVADLLAEADAPGA